MKERLGFHEQLDHERGSYLILKSVLSGAASAYYLLQLRRNQWKSPQELKNIQLKKLKNLVHYAYNFIPYYRRLFKSVKFKPNYLKSQSVLGKIPTTNKMDVRKNFSDIFPKGVDTSKYEVSYTSGSTGIPLKVLSDQKTIIYSTAVVAYCSMECGLSFRDKMVKIGNFRSNLQYSPNQMSIYTHKGSAELEMTINRLRRIQPDAIYALPWVLHSISTVDVSGIMPKLIFSHGETLTQHTRNLVRSKFEREINDTYASVEFNRMAFECNEHSGLHIITDNSVVEFLDDDEPISPGETGETVVTGLSNYAMPLIRYELGDLGVPTEEKCSCGRSWPLIKSIEGRLDDTFILESGRKIYPDLFNSMHALSSQLSKNIFCVSEFQIVQERRNRIILKYVKGRDFDRNIITCIRENIEKNIKILGEDVIVETQKVKKIPIERSGKKKIIKALVE